MNTNTFPITVRILDREYHIACPAGEEDALIKSATQLHERMQEIKQSGKVTSTDRLAVIAALNIINEFSAEQSTNNRYSQIHQHLQEIQLKIDQQLELFE